MSTGDAPRPTGSTAERALTVGWLALALTAAALGALWALDSAVLETALLARFRGLRALTPLYAFFGPHVRATVLVFPLVAFALVFLAPRLCDPLRTRPLVFATSIFALAAVGALALFLVRAPPGSLGANWNLYHEEEFWHDALRIRITDVRVFLDHYVELMPRFSTHGKHFPPGPTLLLWGVLATFGRNEVAAGIAVLTCAAAAVPFVWLALREIASERAARQGAVLVACAPAFVDFACTSIDAVFLLFASIALWLGLRAFGARGRPRDAVLAGVALFAATFVSFSAFPLGLCLALYAIVVRRARAITLLVATGATYAACAFLLWRASGFALWECLATGNDLAQVFMARVRASREHTERWRIIYGNAVAFALGAGVPLVAACAVQMTRHGLRAARWRGAALAALAVMCAIHYLETERIWLYALPWVAGIALEGGALDDRSLRRLAAVSLAQALAMEALLFTLW